MKTLFRTTAATLAASAFLLLMACGGGIAIKRDFKLDPAGSKGVAVMSVTSEGTTGGAVDFMSLNLTLTRKADGKSFEFTGIGKGKQALEPGVGMVVGLALEPGEYSITKWVSTIWNPNPNGGGCEANMANSAPFDIPFSVKAKEVVYVGNQHYVIKIAGVLGQEVNWKLVVSDRRARDLELFKTQYPHLAQHTVGGTPKPSEQVLKAKTATIAFCFSGGF